MAIEKLDASLTLDHAIIDHDHQELFEMIQTVTAIIASVNADADDREWSSRVASAIDALRAATIAHFRSEEAIMRMGAYPGIDAHRHQHVLLIDELDRFLSGRLVPGPEGSRLAVKFLEEWFEFHIRIWDSALVRWLKGHDGKRAKRSGTGSAS